MELVLFNNFAIDFVLIVFVQLFRCRKMLKFRTVLASVIGAVIAVYYAAAPSIVQIVVKILLSPLICLIFDKYKGDNFRLKLVDYLRSLAIFVIATYFVGGIVFGLSIALGIDVNSYVLEGVIALSVGICLICIRFIVKRRRGLSTKTVDALIKIGDKCVQTIGLCDSGNTLVDSISGLPVVILSQEVESKLDKLTIDGFLNVKTVSGEKDMPIVSIDEICVGNKRCKAMGALSRKSFDNYDVILQNSIF